MGKDYLRIQQELDRLSREAKKLRNGLKVDRVTFTYEEQELIRRIIKSVAPQIRTMRDKMLAQDILERTKWIDEFKDTAKNKETEQ